MTTDERVIARIAEANPVPEAASPTAQERAEAERILRRVLDGAPEHRPRHRLPLGVLAPVASLVVVLVVAAVVLRTGGSSTTGSAPSGALRITLTALPTPQVPRITGGAMSREIALIRRRLTSLGRGFTLTQFGVSGIVVTAPKARAAEPVRIIRLITQPARLFVYDWEGNALTPNGKTVASQLLTQDQAAVGISQGGASSAGTPGAGGCRSIRRSSLRPGSLPRGRPRRTRAEARPITSSAPRAARHARPLPRPLGRRRCRDSTACSTAPTRRSQTSIRARRPG